MKAIILGAIAAALVAAPAFAADSTQVAMVKNGATFDVQGMSLDIDFKQGASVNEGTFTIAAVGFDGTYKIDGKKMCLGIMGQDSCSDYPEGKGPGDSFEITTDMGPMKVTIRKPKA